MEKEQYNPEKSAISSKSEYIQTIESFAKYIQKEYIQDSDNKSMIISVCDGDNEPSDMVHVIAGAKTLIIASIASLMNQEGMEELFNMARNASSRCGNINVAKTKRRSLRFLYALLALEIFWILCLLGLQLFGTASWFHTVSCLLLMIAAVFLVLRAIRFFRENDILKL